MLTKPTGWLIYLLGPLAMPRKPYWRKDWLFAVTPANIPATEVIAKVEKAVKQLDAEQADTVRRVVNGILQQAEHQSLTSRRRCEINLKAWKKTSPWKKTRHVPVDKGRASVVMDTDTYRIKMSTLIGNGPYQLLNKDPTDRLTRKLSEKLLTLKQS